MKKLLIGLVVLVVIVGGGAFFLLSNLDALVKTAVEEAGTRATGVSVTLDTAKIDIGSGSGALNGLNVDNPPGYETDYVFNLGAVSVNIDLATVSSNPIVVSEVVINAPKVIYELGDGGSNVDVIKSNVERFQQSVTGGAGGGSDSGSSSAQTESGEDVKVVINNLYIRNAEVSVSAGFLQGKALGTSLPEIHLTDIGKEEGGASPADVASQIIAELTAGVNSAVGSLDLEGLAGAATEAVEGAVKGATDAVEGAVSGATDAVGGAAGGAGEKAEEALKGVTEGAGGALKGLIGN